LSKLARPWRPLPLDRFLIGVCHFPEQEPRDQLAHDAALMAEAGIEVARMGEFAWSVFEAEEGRFDFDLFDEAIATLGAHGIDTILCTPTATPPRWLTHKHPEILRVDAAGCLLRHGSRQHADVTHPVFRDYSKRITQALAEHYRENSRVVGWQTDNELNTHFSETHSEAAQRAFRAWLERRYGDIATLNDSWGCVFWNRQYQGFDQVETPVNNRPASADPSHLLDYRRFLADVTRDFQRDQVEILREVQPRWFVFHNVGRLNDIDLRDFGRDLDFLGTDLYPGLRDEFMKAGLGYGQAMQLDVFRGWGGNFIVPEMQLGSGAHPDFAIPALEPGELRRFAMSAIARGADGLLWFRWTSARYGAEAYWMGALDHDRVPRRRYQELKDTIAEIKAIRGEVLGTSVDMDVAVLANDWTNEIAQSTFGIGLPSLVELSLPLHHVCYTQGIRCGFARPGDDLSRAKIAFVPHLAIWNDSWTAQLSAFVEHGGTLVVGARTATRDVNNHILTATPPGPLSGLCGVEVEEFGRIPAPGADAVLNGSVFQVEKLAAGRAAESARREYLIDLGGELIPAAYGYELLRPHPDAEVVARWSSRFLAGEAAITRRRVGAGSVLYVGTYLTHALVGQLFGPLFNEAAVAPPLRVSPGVEISTRSRADQELTFVQNTTAEPVAFAGPDGQIELGSYGCLILREGKRNTEVRA